MIVVTVFLSILNQMNFHLLQNRKENCHHDHIPFNVKGNGNIVVSVKETLTHSQLLVPICDGIYIRYCYAEEFFRPMNLFRYFRIIICFYNITILRFRIIILFILKYSFEFLIRMPMSYLVLD